MKREDIITIAKSAGFKASVGKTDKEGNYTPWVNALNKDVPVEWLERFAKEVIEKDKNDKQSIVDSCPWITRVWQIYFGKAFNWSELRPR